MRKVVIHGPGGYRALQIERDAPEPLRDDDVRIAVRAIGVNFADCVVRMGLYESAKKLVGWPITPGFEASGIVERVGPRVRELKEGDAVFAVTRFGGYRTHLRVPETQVFRVPPELDLVQSAAFPTVFLTAWYAMRRAARAQAGEVALVHSAAGGTGSALLQVGRALGLECVGVVGASHKVDSVRAIGAECIDKSREPLWARATAHAPQGYDVVFDANGVETLRESYEHLRAGGRVVVYGFHTMMRRSSATSHGRVAWPRLIAAWLRTPRFNPLSLTADNRGVIGMNLSYLFDRLDLLELAMGELLGWLHDGKIHAPDVTTYPFNDVGEAHRALESGSTTGKIALLV